MRLKINDKIIDYLSFGKGKKIIVLIPGLGEGLNPVNKNSCFLKYMYHKFAKDYRVYIFGRPKKLIRGYSTKDMANDLFASLQVLNIQKAHFIGISLGGMIVSQFALLYPAFVDKLVLAVTSAWNNPIQDKMISSWLSFAEQGDYKGLLTSTVLNIYTPRKQKSYRPFIPLAAKLSKPKSFDRFIVQSQAILKHDLREQIKNITAPTLILGAKDDLVVSYAASQELAKLIPQNTFITYNNYGHAVYEENSQFNQDILNFLKLVISS